MAPFWPNFGSAHERHTPHGLAECSHGWAIILTIKTLKHGLSNVWVRATTWQCVVPKTRPHHTSAADEASTSTSAPLALTDHMKRRGASLMLAGLDLLPACAVRAERTWNTKSCSKQPRRYAQKCKSEQGKEEMIVSRCLHTDRCCQRELTLGLAGAYSFSRRLVFRHRV